MFKKKKVLFYPSLYPSFGRAFDFIKKNIVSPNLYFHNRVLRRRVKGVFVLVRRGTEAHLYA